MILVSACLAGINCTYKAGNNQNEKVMELIRKGKAIPICPEQLGGLTTPRSGSRIVSGSGEDALDGNSKLMTDNGEDVTKQYIKGANDTLAFAKNFAASVVILKQGSPSCGNGFTQGGLNSREKIAGDGVTVALLKRNGIKVLSEEDLNDEKIWESLVKE
jgi:uncharacterized protein YbbK (DUF523 family)